MRRLAERALDHFCKSTFFPKNETLRLSKTEIVQRRGIGTQPRAIRFVRREAIESDEAPRDVVRAFVRQEVADQMAAAARNDFAPRFGVLPERVALERIDLIADKT